MNGSVPLTAQETARAIREAGATSDETIQTEFAITEALSLRRDVPYPVALEFLPTNVCGIQAAATGPSATQRLCQSLPVGDLVKESPRLHYKQPE